MVGQPIVRLTQYIWFNNRYTAGLPGLRQGLKSWYSVFFIHSVFLHESRESENSYSSHVTSQSGSAVGFPQSWLYFCQKIVQLQEHSFKIYRRQWNVINGWLPYLPLNSKTGEIQREKFYRWKCSKQKLTLCICWTVLDWNLVDSEPVRIPPLNLD